MGQFESPGESNSAYQRFRKHESEKTPKSNKTKGNKFSSYLQLAKKQVESRTKKIRLNLRKNRLSNSYDILMLEFISTGEQGFFHH